MSMRVQDLKVRDRGELLCIRKRKGNTERQKFLECSWAGNGLETL